LSQKQKLTAKFVEHSHKAAGGGAVGSLDLACFSERFHDQIDRTIVKVQTAIVGQKSYLGAWVGWLTHHSSGPDGLTGEDSGQGFSGRAETCLRASSLRIESSGRT
jgi:hypothetical protein